MSKVKGKVLSAAIAFFLVIAMVGCTSTVTPTGSSKAGSAITPITLTCMAYVNNTTAAMGILKDPISKYITQKTGVSFDMQAISDGDAATKLLAMVAANDLPDITYSAASGTVLEQMITAKEILPLDDLVNSTNAPNMTSDKLAQAGILADKMGTSDGKLYTIGMARGAWTDGTGTLLGDYIRWDLYKQLGYPTISNYDDLANVLSQMQKLEPKDKDGKKTYGTAFFTGFTGYDYVGEYSMQLMSGISFQTPTNDLCVTDQVTHNVSDVNQLKDKTTQFWTSMKFFNKLNQQGLLDPDSFTLSWTDFMDRTTAGQYMMINESWEATLANAKFKTDGTPNKGYVQLPSKIFGYTNITLFSNMTQGERHYSIAATCKYPERAIQVLDFMSTYSFSRIANDGLEGTNWNMVSGKPTPTAAFIATPSGGTRTASNTTGAGYYAHLCGYASGTMDPTTKTPVEVLFGATPLTPMQTDFIQHYGKTSLIDVYSEGMTTTSSSTVTNWGTLPANLTTYATNLQTYETSQATKCILAKTDAAYLVAQDAYINGLATYKVDEMFKFFHDNGAASAIKMAPVYALLK